MNEALAELLAARIRPLPILQRVVGLARPVDTSSTETFDDDKPQGRRIKTPVPVNFPAGTDDCERDDRFLIPSGETESIFFFEDLGTTRYSIAAGLWGNESTLRLLGWVNSPLLGVDAPSENDLIDVLWKALGIGKVSTVDAYAIKSLQATILPAEAALFSKYTYAADATPLLYPPYRLIGLELKCRFLYNPVCAPVVAPDLNDRFTYRFTNGFFRLSA